MNENEGNSNGGHRIGIIVYSQTGNTRLVGQKLRDRLQEDGHRAEMVLLNNPSDEETEEEESCPPDPPVPRHYDAVVFGAPVHAFSLAPPMVQYLEDLSSLRNMGLVCFVTKQLPFVWTGGTRALATMQDICESKGGRVLGTQTVVWAGTGRDERIDRCVQNMCRLLSRAHRT